MVIFVTGGSGFIGSNFLNMYVPEHPQYRFINIDKLTYAANPLNLNSIKELPNYSFEKASITDYAILNSLFQICVSGIGCIIKVR